MVCWVFASGFISLRMHQAPTTVWNGIARNQPLSHPWSILFRMTPEELPRGLESMVDQPIEAMGADSQTVLAYRWVAPLLIENVAISAYLDRSPGSGLRASLPEITSVGDAVMFATVECHLTFPQQAKLKKLLITALKV